MISLEHTKLKDWKVEFIDTNHYAIFHKEVNLEWIDADSGDNLCFETAKKARKYLSNVFKTKE